MREDKPTHVAGVPDTVLDELAQTLADRIDILLDRLTDRALVAPEAGSHAWRSQWGARESSDGREEQARRRSVRAVLALRAAQGLSPAMTAPSARSRTTGAVSRPRSRSRAAGRVDVDQLTMF